MKAVKIILAIVVVAIIGFFVTKWLINIDPPKDIDLPKNQYTERIESEIDSLKKMPESKFCQKYYNDVQYRINDYFNQGFLGNNESDNIQWQEILLKNLYSAYASKFVDQAMFVFNGSTWSNQDLKFIRDELNELMNSSYYEQSSRVFNPIKDILSKYDEISAFIYSCNQFTYSITAIDAHFPDVSDKMQRSRKYLANNLDNAYVNNCTRLRTGLSEIPNKLFYSHVSYLKDKIVEHGVTYKNYQKQSDYSKAIYSPLRLQVDALDYEIYGINYDDYSIEYDMLDDLLNDYYNKAYEYFKYK